MFGLVCDVLNLWVTSVTRLFLPSFVPHATSQDGNIRVIGPCVPRVVVRARPAAKLAVASRLLDVARYESLPALAVCWSDERHSPVAFGGIPWARVLGC